MTPNTRLMLFYHTKGTSLRRTTYFEPSNVKIGSGVRALQVHKNKVGKGRKGKENKNLGWHFPTSLGKNVVQ
jgi:hypothetical protein